MRLIEYYTQPVRRAGDGGESVRRLADRHRLRRGRAAQRGQGHATRAPAGSSGTSRPRTCQGDFARLKAAGAIVVVEPYDFEESPNTTIATLADPDGNYFQLMSPMAP